MRLWFFNFDRTISTKATDRSATGLDPKCDALLRRLSEISSDQVVIVSNRGLDDIAGRINIPGVIIGGCSGIEWQFPNGFRIGSFRDHEENLIFMRAEIVSELYEIISGQGFEIEDKLWSIAVRSQKTNSGIWRRTQIKVSTWAKKHGLTFYCGPDEVDVQMIKGFNKSVGISYLSRLFNIDPDTDSVVYAGDNGSDAIALWWTVLFGGTAIMIGSGFSVPGALYAKDSSQLVEVMDKIVSLP